MEQAYAQALLTTITDGMNPTEAVKSLHALITQEGRMALFPGIARAFSQLASDVNMQDRVEITVSKSEDVVLATSAVQKVLGAIGIDSPTLHTKVDDTIIGGWRAQGSNILVDNSFKSHLLHLFRESTQTI